jgi:hypothetical protein
MKKLTKRLISVATLTLAAATPAFAGVLFTVDFEKNWDYANGDVAAYYGGGAAADGSTGGANLGVSFSNVSGLSNDSSFTYYAGAPSPAGTAYAHDNAYMNLSGGGFSGALSFFYSSPSDVQGAVKAYSGLDGTGTLLGSFDLSVNDLGGALTETGNYATWSLATFAFSGIAQSFDFSAMAGVVGIDNISAIPEPGSLALLIGALGVLGFVGQRKKQHIVQFNFA